MSQTARSEDPYQKICRAMEPGLLITVNCSDPTTTGIDEMKVLRVDDSGDVHLRAHSGEHFVLTHNDPHYDTPVIKEVGETEFSPIHDPVTTIEVIGIE
jgi:hypothetical protein